MTNERETLKVQTHTNLYRGAKIEIAPGVYRVVVRADASSWSAARGFRSFVEVEPTLPCVGDYTIDATVID